MFNKLITKKVNIFLLIFLFLILLMQFNAIQTSLTENQVARVTEMSFKETIILVDGIEYISFDFNNPDKIVYVPYSDKNPFYCEVYNNGTIIDGFSWDGHPIYYHITSVLSVALHNFTFALYNNDGDEATFTSMITIYASRYVKDTVKQDDSWVYLILIIAVSVFGFIGYKYNSSKFDNKDSITREKEIAVRTKKGLDDIQKIINEKQSKTDSLNSSVDRTKKIKRR